MSTRTGPLKAAFICAFLGALWIVGSVLLVEVFLVRQATFLTIQITMGLLYIIVATFLVYAQVVRGARRAEQDRDWYRSLFEISPDPVFIVAADGRVLQVNDAAADCYGYSSDELLAMNVRDLTQDASKHRLEAFLVEALRYPQRFQWRHTTKHGRIIVAEAASRPVQRDGERCILCTERDVTAIEQAEQALRDSERRYRLLADNTLDVIWMMDLETRFTYVNPAVEAMLGLAPEQFTGTLLADHCDDAHAAEMHALIANELEHVDHHPSVIFETVMQHRDGSPVPVEIHSRFLRDEGGQVYGLQGTTRDVTERKRAEASLRNSERRYRALFENAPVGIFTTDSNGRTLSANPTMARILGCGSSEEAESYYTNLGQQLYVDSARRDEFVRLIREVSEVENFEYEARARDGRLLWLSMNARVAQRNDDGSFLVEGFTTDVTERKHAEEELRRRESQLQRIFDIVPVGLWFANREGHIVRANRAGVAIWGAEPHVPLHEYGIFKGRFLPSRQEITPESWALARTIQEGMTIVDELLEIDAFDGKQKVIVNSSAPILDDRGNVDGAIVVNLDVTERHRAEEELESAKNLLEKTLASLDEAVFVLDATTRTIVQCNAAVESIFGYTAEELIGQSSEVLHVDEASYAKFASMGDPVLEVHQTLHLEYRMRRKDGQVIDTEHTVAAMSEEHGWQSGVVSVVRDITERKRAEADREKLEAQLRQAQKLEAVGRLAGGVAHDFNNMLMVILGHAEMALDSLQSSEPLYAHLVEIANAGHRSADLTRQLLAFARKQTIMPRRLDLNDTVEGMLKMLGRLIGEDIELRWKPASNLWPLKMDPAQLDQVLANLVVNARDAIRGPGRITIETRRAAFDGDFCTDHPDYMPGDYVALVVRDDGIGMDKETMANIFEPFFSTKPQGEGTGLGLATVHGIVNQNAGFIRVESEPGDGAAFWIYIPRLEEPATRPDARVQPQETSTGSETVLLVEDEPALLNLARRLLERLGYQVIPMGSPEDALTYVRENPAEIHLLLTDVVMPAMSGRALWQEIQQIRPAMKCVFMSGYTTNIMAERGVLDDDVHLLEKPFSLESMAAKLREVLGD